MQISKEQYNKLPERLQKHFSHGNINPCVKPITLMRYLCRLITPPKGIVLDNFAGSGSTGVASIAEGFQFIGMEDVPEFCVIGNKRITKADQEISNDLF